MSKLNNDDHIRIALEVPKTQNSILSDMKNKLSELRKNYNIQADLKVSKSVTEAMKNNTVVLERK